MPTAADLQTRWPATFGAVDTAVLDRHIAAAYLECVNRDALGAKYEEAVICLAAAKYSETSGPGGQGPVSSMTAGKISMSWSGNGKSRNMFRALYEDLISSVPALRFPL